MNLDLLGFWAAAPSTLLSCSMYRGHLNLLFYLCLFSFQNPAEDKKAAAKPAKKKAQKKKASKKYVEERYSEAIDKLASAWIKE